jgi:glycerol-3-phosphate acyltransferase PlsX
MALISMPVLSAFRKRLDPRCYNGASFLGLRGIVVKSHGGADAFAFKHAIIKAVEEARSGVLAHISEQLALEYTKSETSNTATN